MSILKKYKRLLLAIVAVILLGILANFLITNAINKKVQDLLSKADIENYTVSVKHVRFNLFDRSLLIRDFLFSPEDSAMIELKDGVLERHALNKISATRIQLKGVHLLPLIFSRDIRVNKLLVDDLLYQKFINKNIPATENESGEIKLDSIRIEGLNGLELDRLKFDNLKVQIIDLENGEITFQNDPIEFEMSGFRLEKVGPQHFRPLPVKDVFDIRGIRVDFTEKNYSFSIDGINVDLQQGQTLISGVALTPMIPKEELAASYPFNTEVYTISMEGLSMHGFNWRKAFEGNGYFIDSINISGFLVDIYKDKRKPFNEQKRPKFLHDRLKQMKTPLRIQRISMENSGLFYEERLENKDLLLKVTMSDMSLQLDNVTSIRTYREEPLRIESRSKLMGKADLQIHLVLPLKDNESTFYFSGTLGPSRMKYYDSAIIPALGLKVLNGDIDSMTFEAQANHQSSSGSMTLLYHDMEAEVFKLGERDTEKSGFLSWSVNQLIHRSNPGNNGQVRVAAMQAERVEYKGMGNYLWKTLQSGIVNTVAPFGTSPEKAAKKEERRDRKEERRRKRDNN